MFFFKLHLQNGLKIDFSFSNGTNYSDHAGAGKQCPGFIEDLDLDLSQFQQTICLSLDSTGILKSATPSGDYFFSYAPSFSLPPARRSSLFLLICKRGFNFKGKGREN